MHSTRVPPGRAASAQRRAASALRRAAAASAAALAIVACGTQDARVAGGSAGGIGPGPAGSARPTGRPSAQASTATASPAAQAVTCQLAAVRVTLDPGLAGIAAGTSYIPLDFTNISAAPCRIGGYPVVTLASRSGKQLGAAAQDDHNLAAQNLTLAAGRAVHVWLHVADVMNLPAAQCQPMAAAGLMVALPGQQSAIFIGHALTTCHKQVNGIQLLTVEPFQPGLARQGTAR